MHPSCSVRIFPIGFDPMLHQLTVAFLCGFAGFLGVVTAALTLFLISRIPIIRRWIPLENLIEEDEVDSNVRLLHFERLNNRIFVRLANDTSRRFTWFTLRVAVYNRDQLIADVNTYGCCDVAPETEGEFFVDIEDEAMQDVVFDSSNSVVVQVIAPNEMGS